MQRLLTPLTLAGLALVAVTPAAAQDNPMTFFITSSNPGNGADLGGLEGADAFCQTLAEAAGAGDLTWHAYLSTTGSGGVNARDRIGDGPWYNHAGTLVARDVEHLHSNGPNMTKGTILTETGEQVNGRGDSPNQHDILTGSTMEGMASDADGDTTCGNWTSSGEGSALVGHHDRMGGGANPSSFNSAHGSRGCSLENLRGTGGDGRFYCFAINGPSGEVELALERFRRVSRAP
ncbi:MAG: hypothetical protein MJB57_06100 [Gemmatimonadetes bacterium]|nr:hypothetical protein [Gemmatimonadota bacterium]